MSRRSGRRVSDVTSGIILAGEFSGLAAGALDAGSGAGSAFEIATGFRLTRASQATVQTGTSTVVIGLGNDTARIGRTNDANFLGLSFEESRTNVVTNSQTINSWTHTDSTADGSTTAPDGGSSDVRADASAVAYGTETSNTVASTAYIGTCWHKHTAGTTVSRMQVGAQDTFGDMSGVWKRLIGAAAVTATTMVLYHASDNPPSVTATGSAAWWGGQLEAAAFPTELILTAGAGVVRAGERLYLETGSSALSNGRITVTVRLRPKGSGTGYANNMYLWYVDANNYAVVNQSTRVITVAVGSVTWASDPMASWTAGQTLDIFVAAGGGNLATYACYRVNDGARVNLGVSLAPHAAITIAGNLDVLCSGTTGQFTAHVEHVRFYASGTAPSWVSGTTTYAGDFTGTIPGFLPGGTATNNSFTNATGFRITRASAGTVQTGPTTIDISNTDNNAARFGKSNAAWQTGLVIEESRTNLCVQARTPQSLAVAGSGDTYTTGQTDISGDANAVRVQVTSGGYSKSQSVVRTAQSYTVSMWRKAMNAANSSQFKFSLPTGAQGAAYNGSWSRNRITFTASAGSGDILPSDGRDQTAATPAGIVAGARDDLIDFIQDEAGKFPTEAIITSGVSASRAADIVSHQSAGTMLGADSKHRIELSFRPKGAIGEYPSYAVFCYFASPSVFQVLKNTGANTVYIDSAGGTSGTFPIAMSWAALDLVDMYAEVGGGVSPILYYRVNGGAATSLGTPANTLTAVRPTSPFVVCSQNGGFVVSSWLYNVRIYQQGQKPSWVP